MASPMRIPYTPPRFAYELAPIPEDLLRRYEGCDIDAAHAQQLALAIHALNQDHVLGDPIAFERAMERYTLLVNAAVEPAGYPADPDVSAALFRPTDYLRQIPPHQVCWADMTRVSANEDREMSPEMHDLISSHLRRLALAYLLAASEPGGLDSGSIATDKGPIRQQIAQAKTRQPFQILIPIAESRCVLPSNEGDYANACYAFSALQRRCHPGNTTLRAFQFTPYAPEVEGAALRMLFVCTGKLSDVPGHWVQDGNVET